MCGEVTPPPSEEMKGGVEREGSGDARRCRMHPLCSLLPTAPRSHMRSLCHIQLSAKSLVARSGYNFQILFDLLLQRGARRGVKRA